MRKKVKTLTASFLCMCLLLASGCGSSDDSDVGGLNGRNNGSGGGGQATTQATTTDIWGGDTTQATTQGQATTQATQAPATTEATTQQQATTQATQQQVTTEATTQQTSSGALATKKIENEYYSVTVPDGWTWEEWGAFSSFCFRCTNPQDPSMTIIYAGELFPIFTSEQQKTPYYNLGEGGQIYIDAPVFYEESVGAFYQQYENIYQFQMKYQGFSLFPKLTNIAVQDYQITNDAMHTINTNFTDSQGYASAVSENGTSVVSVCKASIGGAPMDLFAVGYDNSPRSIVCLYYVECPQDRQDVLETLIQCVTSLQFTDKALQEQQEALNGSSSNIGQTSIDDLLQQSGSDIQKPDYDLPLPDGSATMDEYDK